MSVLSESLARLFNHAYRSPTPPVFAVGTGRCGTHFLQRILDGHEAVLSQHMPCMDEDSFHRYCVWNELPVDHAAFVESVRRRVAAASEQGKVYFEANSYFSFSIPLLSRAFDAKWVFVIRNPTDVVNSHVVKGWYENAIVREDAERAPGFQPGQAVNHTFGRILPRGAEFHRWRELTQIGKLAWMWNAVNLRIAEQLRSVPGKHKRQYKIEELDYHAYQDLFDFVGGKGPISEDTFKAIRSERPAKGRQRKSAEDWSRREREEFLRETEKGREVFGYEMGDV